MRDFTGDNADWRWTLDGESLGNFTNWNPTQPDKAVQQCGAVFGSDLGNYILGRWLDRPCDIKYRAICETDRVSNITFLK